MSQRNPMNDRYLSDQPKGQTKRSASSLKPKTKAASSVYVRSNEKTPKEKKAIRREQRQKQRQLDSIYYNPPTAEYKQLRRLWWGFIIAAIVLTCAAMFVPQLFPDSSYLTWVMLIPAYIFIALALWLDFGKIRKVRRHYQEQMTKKHGKELRKYLEGNESGAQAQKDEAQGVEEKSEAGSKKRHIFGMKKKTQAQAETKAEAASVSAQEPSSENLAAAQAQADAQKPIAQLKAEHEAAKQAAKEAAQTKAVEE